MPPRNVFTFHRTEKRIPMEIPVVLDGHRQLPGTESTFTENECARRACGECAPLGKRRTADVRFAHWRVSLLGSSGLLPATAWRRLCGWRGVPRTQRAMGCLNPRDSSAQRLSGRRETFGTEVR